MKYNEQAALQITIACQVAAGCLDFLSKRLEPGITTKKLDDLAADYFYRHGATSASRGYKGFPAHICTSINEEICHGIPSDRVLKEGDIIGIDTACIVNGWYGDTCGTFGVGEIDLVRQHLINSARDCTYAGIDAIKVGGHVGDIGHAVYQQACRRGLAVVRDYVGHGVGSTFHEPPQIPHVGKKGMGHVLEEGMIFTVEPMINLGDERTLLKEDGWTAVTPNNMPSAQFEHTVYIGPNGVEVLTELEGAE